MSQVEGLQEVLQHIGLTKGESEVYLCLLKVGNTSSGLLIKESGVSRSKVYEVLERLKQKGLATEMIRRGVKYFEATNPKKVVEYIGRQKKELVVKEKKAKEIVPTLEKLRGLQLEKQAAKVYVGFEGWKSLYEEILENLTRKDEYLAFGVSPEDLKDKRLVRFFRTFHMKRDEKGVRARLLLKPALRCLVKEKFSDLKTYRCRYSHSNFPTNVNVHKDIVVTLVWGEQPVAFVVQSEQVARKYKKFFEAEWEKGKE